MLVIRVKKHEPVYIDDNIALAVRAIGKTSVELSIDAPREIKILRKSLLEKSRETGKEIK